MNHADKQAVMALDSAVRAWGEAAEDTARKASVAVKRVVSDTESEVQARRRRVAELEAALAAAKGEERALIARELRVATAAFDHGRRSLRQAQEAARRMQVLEQRVVESARTRVPQASAELRRKAAALDTYERERLPLWKEGILTAGAFLSLGQQVSAQFQAAAQLQKTNDASTSQQILDEKHSKESVDQLGEAYSHQVLDEAKERNRHLGERPRDV